MPRRTAPATDSVSDNESASLVAERDRVLRNRLTVEINRDIRGRNLTQRNAGKILGISQPQVSDLMRGRARAFSAERLLQFLTALGHDVEIHVKPPRNDHGELSVIVAGAGQ
jgi:predicted XRE-type DNA-binding protein